MMEQRDFFRKYNIKAKAFRQTGLKWAELRRIYDDYMELRTTLEPNMAFIVDCLQRIPAVHSVKYRLKDAEHLVEKLIRKRIQGDTTEVSAANYTDFITDLIGIRVLHLFKEDWRAIHESVTKTWTLKQTPVANIRKGDHAVLIEQLKKAGCDINEHPYGYRSIHYVVQSSPSKRACFAEIQVRTIFEEGWSEIDHRTRYPYNIDNPLLGQFLVIFNRLAGSADEMGEFIRFLKRTLAEREAQYTGGIKQKEEAVRELKKKIDKLKIEKSERTDLNTSLDYLQKLSFEIKVPKLKTWEFVIPDIKPYTIEMPSFPKLDLPLIDYTTLHLPGAAQPQVPESEAPSTKETDESSTDNPPEEDADSKAGKEDKDGEPSG